MKYFAAFLLLLSLTYAQEKMQAPTKEKPAAHPAAPASFKTTIQTQADDWKAAFQVKDADKLAAMYSGDAVWINPEGTFRGSNDIKGELKKMIDRGDTVDAITTAKAVHSGKSATPRERIAAQRRTAKEFNNRPLVPGS